MNRSILFYAILHSVTPFTSPPRGHFIPKSPVVPQWMQTPGDPVH